jgi:hypothetical protein
VAWNTCKSRTSENELSDVPEKIINALHSFDCDSDEDFVGFEWPQCTVCVQWMIFCVSCFILVFVTWNTCKSRTSENEMKLWNHGFKLP